MPLKKKKGKMADGGPPADESMYASLDEPVAKPSKTALYFRKKEKHKNTNQTDNSKTPESVAKPKPVDAFPSMKFAPGQTPVKESSPQATQAEYEYELPEDLPNPVATDPINAREVLGACPSGVRHSDEVTDEETAPEIPRKCSVLQRTSATSGSSVGSTGHQGDRLSLGRESGDRSVGAGRVGSHPDKLSGEFSAIEIDEDFYDATDIPLSSNIPPAVKRHSGVHTNQCYEGKNTPSHVINLGVRSSTTEVLDQSQSQNSYQTKILPVSCIEGDATLPSKFDHPWGICVSRLSSTIYITDVERCQVIQLDHGGRVVSVIGARGIMDGEFNGPQGLALQHDDSFLAVCDTKNRRMQLLDTAGRFIRKFGSDGPAEIQMKKPVGVALDQMGSVYVVDQLQNVVSVWSEEGEPLRRFGCEGSKLGQMRQPQGLALSDREDLIVVADTNNHRLQIFSTDGAPRSAIGQRGSLPGEFNAPRAVAMDADGWLVVTDDNNNRVQVVTGQGAAVHVIGGSSRGSEEGQFDQPVGVAMGAGKKVYVCEYINRRIQMF